MSFDADISRFINKAGTNTEQVIRKIAIQCFSKVVLKSPVDTGRFRANWYASINYASNDVSNAVDKSGMKSIGNMQDTVAGFKLSDTSIYFSNNLPYAYRLEMGYSKQAPAGMARISVMETARQYA